MIYAVILDGTHRNTVLQLPNYLPIIRIPTEAHVNLTQEGAERITSKHVEYKAAFHAVDQDVVLYSTTGESLNFLDCDSKHVDPTLGGGLLGRREHNYFVRVRDAS